MTKLNFTRKFLVSAITLFAVNFAVANDENILKLNTLSLEKLPHLNAQKKISLAGLSAGGFMSVQYQIAYSNDVSGVAIIAGGPYNCTENSFNNISRCMNPTQDNMPPSAETQLKIIKDFANKNSIDNPENLKKHKVWLYTSKKDEIINFQVMQRLNEFYDTIYQQNNNAQKQYFINENAGHAWITNLGKNTCETNKISPHINNCNDYDLAENYLKFFFPNQVSNDKNNPKYNTDLSNIKGRFVKFSQSDIQQKYNIKNAEMADEGFAFIPKQCENKDNIEKSTCAIHFVLHGCSQNLEAIGDKFIYQTGVWRYADKYNLIVVYPITKNSAKNPAGCWDWYGYTGENYAIKQAPQMQTLNAIAKELQSK